MASRRHGNAADPFGDPREELTVNEADSLLFGNINPMIDLADLRLDGGTQPRANLDQTTIQEYADDMRNGDRFPPVTVFYDGTTHWLADGFHRVAAAALAGLDKLRADIKQGTRRDAVLFSVGVNAAHGKRRTNADKRRAVMTMLSDPEWSEWSGNKIAKLCHVSESYVRKLRDAHFAQNEVKERTYVTKHGTVATMKTGKIGSATGQQEPAQDENSKPVGIFEDAPGSQSPNRVGNLPHSPIPAPEVDSRSNAALALLVADLGNFGELADSLRSRVERLLEDSVEFPPSALDALDTAIANLSGWAFELGGRELWATGLLDLLLDLQERERGGDGTDG